jgi:hypothetical protein
MATASSSSPSFNSRRSLSLTSYIVKQFLQYYSFFTVFVAGILIGSFLNSFSISSTTTQRQLIDDINNYPYSTLMKTDSQNQKRSDNNHNYIINNNSVLNVDGWQTVHVFYGSVDYPVESQLWVPKERPVYYYSQARQDEVVLNLLRNKTNGYFVDLAANDATALSNSYTLERFYGWKGLCVSIEDAVV